MAEALNRRATEAYRLGKLVEARDLYRKASKSDQEDAKYPSNLSAVLFELGQYGDCAEAIKRAWGRLAKANLLTPESPMALKLATRFAKTVYHDASLAKELDLATDIARYVDQHPSERDPKVVDMRDWWKAARSGPCIPPGDAEFRRALSVPIFKSTEDPTLEYYPFGHNVVQSLRDPINGDEETQMTVEFMGESEKKKFSCLIGGVGDGRHAFATIVDFGSSKCSKRLHLTLFDVHPSSAAKLVVIFQLLHDIRTSKDPEEKTELYATLTYLYSSIVMPPYCSARLRAAAAKLVTTLQSPSSSGHRLLFGYLSIPESTVPKILDSLEYWSGEIQASTNTFLKRCPRKIYKWDEPASDEPRNPRTSGDVYTNNHFEQELYSKAGVLLPPPSLLERHPAINKAVQQKKLSSSLVGDARREVHGTWKPNATLFDSRLFLHSPDDIKRIRSVDNGCPQVEDDHAHSIGTFHTFVDRFSFRDPVLRLGRERTVPKTACSVMGRFFELVLEAFTTHEGKITVELVVDDVFSGLQRLYHDPGRPRHYPTKFSRMWLSNVPDYTGGALTNAIFLVPYLIESPTSLMAWNCLLNTTVWMGGSIADAEYHYTLVQDSKHPSFLGFQLVHPEEPEAADTSAIPTGRPLLQNLPSKADVHLWLSDILLNIVKSSRSLRGLRRIDQPHNFGTFVHLLIYLHSHIGIPAHWITDFLSIMIHNKLDTIAMYHRGELPIPPSHDQERLDTPRRVNLLPWLEDLRLVISDLNPLIHFPLPIDAPSDYILPENNIITLHAHFKPQRHLEGDYLKAGNPYVPTVGMAFHKFVPALEGDPDFGVECLLLHDGIVELLEGPVEAMPKEIGGFHISMTMLSVDLLQKNTASWRMRKDLYEKMVKEGWKVVLFRTESGLTLTEAVGARDWSEAPVVPPGPAAERAVTPIPEQSVTTVREQGVTPVPSFSLLTVIGTLLLGIGVAHLVHVNKSS
ncbi:hypothetical protein BKA70DRAFT_1442577 [Coprinopsis sp. MPI-PUGE-AT-0042]|nr:hypothetical protein BKA70DRAFT_1442577 [Coprinopsis sp. MPI-PUGE-AT-0042]